MVGSGEENAGSCPNGARLRLLTRIMCSIVAAVEERWGVGRV